MSEGEVKSIRVATMGQCADCGTLHIHGTVGGICYLCGGDLVAKGAIETPAPVASPCSKALINELYARTESD